MSCIHREAACYHNLGKLFQSVGDYYTRAKKNFNKVIVIRKEIGDKKREASFYGNLGDVFASVSECARKLDNCFKKQLTSERKLKTKTEKEQI